MSALAQYVLAILGLLTLGGIYTALERIASALERQTLIHEKWHGDSRTALMFPDDAPTP